MSRQQSRPQIPWGLLVVAAAVAYFAYDGTLAENAQLCEAGGAGAAALTVARYGRNFIVLRRVAIAVALLFGASMPLLAWAPMDLGSFRAAAPEASASSVAIFLEETSRASLGRALTKDERERVWTAKQPLGPRAADSFNEAFAARWQRDVGERRAYEISPAQWGFWQELCKLVVTYDLPDPEIAPTLRRYIGAFLSPETRFHLDPALTARLRRAAPQAHSHGNVKACAELFDFPA